MSASDVFVAGIVLVGFIFGVNTLMDLYYTESDYKGGNNKDKEVWIGWKIRDARKYRTDN